ncbi:MAG: hypothetical protein ACUVXI_07720 [bacterium]
MKIVEVEIFDVKMGSGGGAWNPVIVRIKTDEGTDGAGEVALA